MRGKIEILPVIQTKTEAIAIQKAVSNLCERESIIQNQNLLRDQEVNLSKIIVTIIDIAQSRDRDKDRKIGMLTIKIVKEMNRDIGKEIKIDKDRDKNRKISIGRKKNRGKENALIREIETEKTTKEKKIEITISTSRRKEIDKSIKKKKGIKVSLNQEEIISIDKQKDNVNKKKENNKEIDKEIDKEKSMIIDTKRMKDMRKKKSRIDINKDNMRKVKKYKGQRGVAFKEKEADKENGKDRDRDNDRDKDKEREKEKGRDKKIDRNRNKEGNVITMIDIKILRDFKKMIGQETTKKGDINKEKIWVKIRQDLKKKDRSKRNKLMIIGK